MFDVLTSIYMRTTLDISDDVLQAAKERARREGTSVGSVISDLARLALNSRPENRTHARHKVIHGFEPFPSRGAIITNDLIDRLRDDDAY
jgi:hypothetical protein